MATLENYSNSTIDQAKNSSLPRACIYLRDKVTIYAKSLVISVRSCPPRHLWIRLNENDEVTARTRSTFGHPLRHPFSFHSLGQEDEWVERSTLWGDVTSFPNPIPWLLAPSQPPFSTVKNSHDPLTSSICRRRAKRIPTMFVSLGRWWLDHQDQAHC